MASLLSAGALDVAKKCRRRIKERKVARRGGLGSLRRSSELMTESGPRLQANVQTQHIPDCVLFLCFGRHKNGEVRFRGSSFPASHPSAVLSWSWSPLLIVSQKPFYTDGTIPSNFMGLFLVMLWVEIVYILFFLLQLHLFDLCSKDFVLRM